MARDLTHEDSQLREAAASAICGCAAAGGFIPEGYVQALALRLQDKNESVGYRAASAIGRVANSVGISEDIVRALVSINDMHWRVAQNALYSIGLATGKTDISEEIVHDLARASTTYDKDVGEKGRIQVRQEAALTIGEVGRHMELSEDTLQALADASSDSHRLVRQSVAVAIGNAAAMTKPSVDSVEALVRLFFDGDSGVRGAAYEAIAKPRHEWKRVRSSSSDEEERRDADWALGYVSLRLPSIALSDYTFEALFQS